MPFTPWILSGLLAVVALALLVLLTRKDKKAANRASNVGSDLQLGAVPTLRRTKKQLSNELARVRRYHRPLSIVVLRLESDQLLLDLKRNLVPESGNGSVEAYNQVMQTIQLVFSLVGALLKESLRESDIATYDVPNNQYIIMLAESSREQAALTVTRLKKLLFKRTAGHLVAGIAEFPEDGLILEDLIARAVDICSQDMSGSVRKATLGPTRRQRDIQEKKKIDEASQSK